MTMTVARLHKELGKMIAAGHGRKPVAVNTRTFWHPLEDDGAVILNVVDIAAPEFIYNVDDDGGIKINQDGTESGRFVVVLRGDNAAQGGRG